MTKNRSFPWAAALAGLFLVAGQVFAGQVEEKIETPVHQALGMEQKTQAAQTAWRAEKEKKTAVFEALEKELAALEEEKVRKRERNKILKAKVAQKEQQIADIVQIENQISPFLADLLDRITTLFQEDLPFLQEERQKRIQALESLNRDPAVQVSERFRKIMEALVVEAEYGQTVEVYQQTVELAGEDTLVNIFRLGRLRLFYQTLDKLSCGYFHTAQKAWVPLDKSYLKTIQAAVDMGSRRKPVEILDLPVGRMVVQ